MVRPPEQFSPNSPSLKTLPPCMRWSRRLVIRGSSIGQLTAMVANR